MSNDLLVALSIGLLPISLLNLWQAFQYQLQSRRQPNTEISEFVWGLLFWQIAIFMSCVLYLLWDFDLIYKSTQYKLSVMPRSFFLIGSIFFYHGLNKNMQDRSLAVAMIILIIMVVFSAKVMI